MHVQILKSASAQHSIDRFSAISTTRCSKLLPLSLFVENGADPTLAGCPKYIHISTILVKKDEFKGRISAHGE
jgi:hypothetical protein